MGESVSATGIGWLREITRYQWMVFLIAWLGWSLVNTDFNLFALVLRPAVTELLGGTATAATASLTGIPGHRHPSMQRSLHRSAGPCP